MYCLSIKYNDFTLFRALSNAAGGLGAMLSTTAGEQMCLRVLVTRDNERADYFVRTVRPGDSIRISYRASQSEDVDNMASIANCERTDTYCPSPGMRLGIDVETIGKASIRLSHPTDGALNLIIGNVPLRHARTTVLAYSEAEEWSWQLSNLLDGVALEMKVVETDWCSTFPNERLRSFD
jgi:hypothetical protein